jgi:maltooligosyltrehalose trehalohydrolase
VADPQNGSLPSPVEEATFQKCKLELNERRTHAAAYALHRDLLRIRSRHTAITDPIRIDGAVLTSSAMALRYFGKTQHFLLIVNLGVDIDLSPAPEPLLAPPGAGGWLLKWSSESMTYGGQGTPPLWQESEWRIPGEAAVLLVGEATDGHGR